MLHGKVIGIHMHARLGMDKCGSFAEFALQRSAVGFMLYEEEETQHFAYHLCIVRLCVQIHELLTMCFASDIWLLLTSLLGETEAELIRCIP